MDDDTPNILNDRGGPTDSATANNDHDADVNIPTSCPGCTCTNVDCFTFNSHSFTSPLQHAAQALILGLMLYSTYDIVTPLDPALEVSPISVNPDPTQFTLSKLTTWKSCKLHELQHLDMLMESMDPDPDAHIWKCIAVTNHKL